MLSRISDDRPTPKSVFRETTSAVTIRTEFILFDGHIQPGIIVKPQFLGNIVTRKLKLVFPDELERDLIGAQS